MCFRNACQSAPTDGRDQSTNTNGQSIFLTSKQNSDACGMFYQWGRKDPFTFATSSIHNGTDRGKYPVKIYTIDGVLIYQESNGSSNTDKQPIGGVILSSTYATSMLEVIKNPITFYGGREIISQTDHTKSLWDYYWTSYSRGTDGNNENTVNHNIYLDDYISQRPKSIYDPCPYGFKIPSNGTFEQLVNIGWIKNSYLGGNTFKELHNFSWIASQGSRDIDRFVGVGEWIYNWSSTINSRSMGYFLLGNSVGGLGSNELRYLARGFSVRCIDFATFVSPPRPTDEMLVEQLLRLIMSL